ncbi:MAG: S8 family serine peptidase, partial [Anaerolineae bacterium]|nr:S8 family serine peptidase [Anaerolineae bacterium]
MSDSSQVYTYRAGQKVPLEKEPDQFVVRALPEELEPLGIFDAQQVSSASSTVTVRPTDLEAMMSRSRLVAPTHHAYTVADTGEPFRITDRVFVTFKAGTTLAQIDEFAGRYSLIPVNAYSEREYLYQLTDDTGMNPVKLVVTLMENEPLVESADHDLNYEASTYQLNPFPPSDPLYNRQWHLHTRFTDSQYDRRSSTRCEEAWQILDSFGSPDVVIGVTDDGCRLDHPDFDSADADKFAGWGYFKGSRLITRSDIDADPNKMYESGSNHGTSCAGVIAGEVDGVLTVGAAPGCRLLPIKWESDGPSLFISDSKLRTALDFIADKVDVLSNSWGIVPESRFLPIVTNRIRELAQTGGRRGRGIVFLWAAGNDNCPIQHTATVNVPYTNGWQIFPNGTASWVGVQTSRRFSNSLVDIPGVVHVAALASNAQRSHYSNYGTGVGICAPTNNVHSYYRLSVIGLGITTTTGASNLFTESFGGTSSATPLTAGVAGLVISANPNLTAMEVISILKRTASKDLNMSGYARTPSASYNSDTSWDISPIAPFDQGAFQNIGSAEGTWSPWFGHGRIDAPAAVAEAAGRQPAPAVPNQFTSNPNKAIPDNNTGGVEDVIAVAETGRIQSIQVSVDIEHTWIGDLVVTLTGPDGTAAALHDRQGSSGDNIQTTYDLAAVPALAAFQNREIQGNWTLRVQDLASIDTGTLKSWALAFETLAGPLVVEDAEPQIIPDNDANGITRSLNLPADHLIREIAVAVDITHPWVG